MFEADRKITEIEQETMATKGTTALNDWIWPSRYYLSSLEIIAIPIADTNPSPAIFSIDRNLSHAASLLLFSVSLVYMRLVMYA